MKLKIINGLMFGIVLYLLIDKYRKKKECKCDDKPSVAPIPEKTNETTLSATTDPILESTNATETKPVIKVVEPKPICPFEKFVLYFGEERHIIECKSGKPTANIMNVDPTITGSRTLNLTDSEYYNYEKIRANGRNNDYIVNKYV